MSGENKFLPMIVFLLGFVCLIWIIYDIISIYSDLGSVIHFGTAGLFVGIGYILIIIFHGLVLLIYLLYFWHHKNISIRGGLLFLLIVSFLALIIEKVMYDEVGREYMIEFPLPGETHFIIFGLLLNILFICYALYCIYREFNIFRVNKGHKKND